LALRQRGITLSVSSTAVQTAWLSRAKAQVL
jgi:hypothetical protein